MKWLVVKVSPEQWAKEFSQNAHSAVFQEFKPGDRDRISYALLVIRDELVIGYVTVREIDDTNVYWQFGGVLPRFRKSMIAVKAIETAIEWQRQYSSRIQTYVENTNLAMLKFYISYGFLVIGTRTFEGHVMVDLMKELHGHE